MLFTEEAAWLQHQHMVLLLNVLPLAMLMLHACCLRKCRHQQAPDVTGASLYACCRTAGIGQLYMGHVNSTSVARQDMQLANILGESCIPEAPSLSGA